MYTVAVDTVKVLFKKEPAEVSYSLTIIEAPEVPSYNEVRAQNCGGGTSNNAAFEQSFRLTPQFWQKVPANRNYEGRADWSQFHCQQRRHR